MDPSIIGNSKGLPARNLERPFEKETARISSPVPALYQFYSQNSINGNRALRAVAYCRVSTQEQAQQKTSVPAQLEACKKAASEKGWEFLTEYKDEGISGHLTEERHGLQSMLREARLHKFDVIVVKDYDRFARNKDAAAVIRQELKHLGIQVYAINTPVEPRPVSEYDADQDDIGTMVETVSDMKSDLERKQIIRRMKDGKLSRAKAGKIPNRVPYGYKVERSLEGAKIKRTVVIDDEKAEHVRFIYEQYSRGMGARKILLAMNDRWVSPAGVRWNITAIKYILANPTYIGKVWWGWRHADYKITKEYQRRGKLGYIGDGTHQPIIDEHLFKVVQEIRAGRNRSARGGVVFSRGVLTGLAKCIRCGSGVGYSKRFHSRSKKNPNWRDTYTWEYLCTGYKYRGICSPRVMSAEKLESEVVGRIKDIYANPKVQEKIVCDGKDPEDVDREKEIARLDREISMEEQKLVRQHEAFERGIISIEEYEANVSRIREETGRCHTVRRTTMSKQSLSSQKSESVQKLISSMRDFDVLWGAMQLDEKKMILRSIISQIRAGDGKVEVDFIL